MKNEEVMRGYPAGNYFTLAPNKIITVPISAPLAKSEKEQPTVLVDGWNITKPVITSSVK